MPWTVADLNHEEQLALVGLSILVAYADKEITAQEASVVQGIIDALGHEEFDAIAKVARERFENRDRIAEVTDAVTRPEARAYILAQLQQVAQADGVDIKEEGLMVWLRERWAS